MIVSVVAILAGLLLLATFFESVRGLDRLVRALKPFETVIGVIAIVAGLLMITTLLGIVLLFAGLILGISAFAGVPRLGPGLTQAAHALGWVPFGCSLA